MMAAAMEAAVAVEGNYHEGLTPTPIEILAKPTPPGGHPPNWLDGTWRSLYSRFCSNGAVTIPSHKKESLAPKSRQDTPCKDYVVKDGDVMH